ncbi:MULTISPECIES: class I SAM-dependent methyltransferase [Bradyrhizobium]|uniref:Class I SAM-dependent methyltransferase n=1 Tax=Bradyrhizobium septentrionale TaxID=1404411 RepID=A0A973VXH7_9BRAD|nr:MULTISPECIES: class I SAM-dependent methyltransferase [Bradyrhizobium]QIG93836.1 class I SAM-dependent methyltransferase [Bradyrhizobium sp. 6(2017)]UGY12491.1 class I SAM-dependent methyltransferase [Bradyrhizobium septentrionale]UGY21492.1 class I SAM-dependent methyltransferase [Bradyrhizobium septentrionale]UGY25029.1 class I SAM-dependent methyltransferase [Bradyrhizobium septentrionale]
MVALSTQSKAHPRAVRGRDLYETPSVAVYALLSVEKLPRRIWEPADGNGAISRVLRRAGHRVATSDIARGRDFLISERMPKLTRGIVTNPPFQIAARFAAHAIELSPYVAMLMRLGFLEAGHPCHAAGRARMFCLDEQPPARVYVFRQRLPMMHRAGWKGRRAVSAMAFCWIVWDRRHRGPTLLSRISWEGRA